jgi:hypothetical protein
MGRTVVVRLVASPSGDGLAARLHDVESGDEQVVRSADELVAALTTLAGRQGGDRPDTEAGHATDAEAPRS